MSKELVQIQPTTTDGNALEVNSIGGTNHLRVNTNNNYVTALGNYVNTQYHTFHASFFNSGAIANTHHALYSGASVTNDLVNVIEFGTGTDPETTFTTADTNAHRAADLVPCIWFVKDDITIDDIDCFAGADAATGDAATRFHLMQYTFNSGSTGALTSGSVLAYSASDTNNAGSEQAYKTTLTKSVTDVDAGKVVLAFFRSDSVNSDYSVNVVVKYHLTGFPTIWADAHLSLIHI